MGIYINNNGTIERKDGAPGPAGSIAYDNTESGLVSNNVQNAIDEVNERVIENISDNASIELTATAAHAHAVGTSFMLIGQLVKTTSAIAVGDTIAVGTNVEPTSILDLLGDVNTAISTLNSKISQKYVHINSTYGNVNYTKCANIVVVFGDLYIQSSLPSQTIVVEGLPLSYMDVQGVLYDTDKTQEVGIAANSDKVKLVGSITSGYWRLSLTYVEI